MTEDESAVLFKAWSDAHFLMSEARARENSARRAYMSASQVRGEAAEAEKSAWEKLEALRAGKAPE